MSKQYRSFKLYIAKGVKEYYMVYILNDRESLRLFSKQIFPKQNISRMEAATHSFKAYETVRGKEKLSSMIGAILFYKGGFGHGVVSHEIAHAVNYYFLKHKINFNIGKKHHKDWKDHDETYATMLGYMVNKFWKKYKGKVGKERY